MQLHTYNDIWSAVGNIVAGKASMEEYFTPVDMLGESRKVLDVRVLAGTTEHSVRDLTNESLKKVADASPEGKPLVHVIYDLGRV